MYTDLRLESGRKLDNKCEDESEQFTSSFKDNNCNDLASFNLKMKTNFPNPLIINSQEFQ